MRCFCQGVTPAWSFLGSGSWPTLTPKPWDFSGQLVLSHLQLRLSLTRTFLTLLTSPEAVSNSVLVATSEPHADSLHVFPNVRPASEDWVVEDADFAFDMLPIADRFSVCASDCHGFSRLSFDHF